MQGEFARPGVSVDSRLKTKQTGNAEQVNKWWFSKTESDLATSRRLPEGDRPYKIAQSSPLPGCSRRHLQRFDCELALGFAGLI
jgi:hypothetical protein